MVLFGSASLYPFPHKDVVAVHAVAGEQAFQYKDDDDDNRHVHVPHVVPGGKASWTAAERAQSSQLATLCPLWVQLPISSVTPRLSVDVRVGMAVTKASLENPVARQARMRHITHARDSSRGCKPLGVEGGDRQVGKPIRQAHERHLRRTRRFASCHFSGMLSSVAKHLDFWYSSRGLHTVPTGRGCSGII